MAAQAAPAPADDMIEVTVDGKPVKVAKGSNVLQACDAAGVDVPRCVPSISFSGGFPCLAMPGDGRGRAESIVGQFRAPALAC